MSRNSESISIFPAIPPPGVVPAESGPSSSGARPLKVEASSAAAEEDRVSAPPGAARGIKGLPHVWEEEEGAPGEWASLLGDLTDAGAREATWRVHDRTHLELAVEYPVEPKAKKQAYVWEAYFFIPRSLRVSAASYSTEDIYQDLQSYVRFAVPALSLDELARIPAERLHPALSGNPDHAIRELRLFACQVRASAISARRTLQRLAEEGSSAAMEVATRALLVRLKRVVEAYRAILTEPEDSGVQVTARWVDEDVSRVVETVLGTLSMRLRALGLERPAKLIAGGAVAEARYRARLGHDGVGRAGASKREIEHLEFRRHLLKRFTSSVLWLKREVSTGGRYTLHVLYALAACVAMSFAIAAAAYHGTDWSRMGSLYAWAGIVMLAYAGKDRLKATLQGVFSSWVARHFPQRRWRLLERSPKGRQVGSVQERSSFIAPEDLPPSVREARNSTRQHELVEQARPERVLWHQKICSLRGPSVRAIDDRFASVTEIFRLDLRKWLAHTDDPKQRIYFADPETQRVYSAMAPRVYNIGIVYRVRPKADVDAPWTRVRVVISRKGIKRIERV